MLDIGCRSRGTSPGNPCPSPLCPKNFDRIDRHHRPLPNDDGEESHFHEWHQGCIGPLQGATGQAPSNLTPGWLPVEVINNGVHTEMVLAHVTQNAPGAFMSTVDGVRMAAATKADGVVLDRVHPAAPGDVIANYATGIAPSQAGTVVSTPRQVGAPAVTIGGMNAVVRYAGLIAPGLFQINVVVPAVSSGNQPLLITANKATSPAGVFLPIAGN